jgi:hypothetical protein
MFKNPAGGTSSLDQTKIVATTKANDATKGTANQA